MGLPELHMKFMQKAATAVKRSQKGIVALILKDDIQAPEQTSIIYNSIDEVDEKKFSPENIDFIKKTFMGVPNKIIIEKVSVAATNFNDVLVRLRSKKWNYLAIPSITKEGTSDIVTWIKTMRDNKHKTVKAVLPNVVADHEGIINFATEEIKVGSKTYSAAEYCCRIAGILAGLPFTRSATYYVLPEVESIKDSEDPDKDIDAGKLILINDGKHIKIASGVNSLTSIVDPKGPDWKDILIIDKMDLNRDDITETWAEEYVGKVINIYDNKMLFVISVNAYFKSLTKQEAFFDPDVENKADIDIEAQKLYLESQGIKTDTMKDQDIKTANTGKKVFLNAHVKYTNAMQDLYFNIFM